MKIVHVNSRSKTRPKRAACKISHPASVRAAHRSSEYACHGSALIGLVAAIVVLSVLAAAIVPLIGSSGQQAGYVDLASKAYLMAETGYRVAASRFLHAGANTQDQNQILEQMDGNYTLDDDQGQFEIQVFSYFFETTDETRDDNTTIVNSTIKVHCPGTCPDDDAFPDDPGDEISLNAGLKVSIEDQIYTLGTGSSGINGTDDNLTLTFDGPLPLLPQGTVIYPVATANEGQTPTLTNGGNLAYDSLTADIDTAQMFPLRNGKITVDGLTLSYRFNDRDNNRFVGIRNPNDPDMAHALSTDADIVLARYVRLHATGKYGDDSGVQRRVVYYTPLPLEDSGARRESFSDRFETADNWTQVSGTHSPGVVGEDSALQVDSTVTLDDDKGSLIQFNPATGAASNIDFNAARRGTRGYLNYDSQIKIGYEDTPTPLLSFSPYKPIPAQVAAGLSFRLSGTNTGDATNLDLFESNSYGISFLRGNSSVDSAIPDEIIPLPDTRMIVLWQQTENGAARNWLAYKELPVIIFRSYDFESAVDWSKDPSNEANLWNTDIMPATPHSGSGAWYFGREVTPGAGVFTYQPPDENSPSLGGLVSEEIDLCDAPKITLTFWSWHRTEDEIPSRDQKEVRILFDGTEHRQPAISRDGNEPFWIREEVDLTNFSGESIQVIFHFDSMNGEQNNFAGWMIDDVQILCEDWPLENSTLALRLREAMVVRFNDGQVEIRQGDRIQGRWNNTIGTVIEPPILTSGTWGSTPAAAGTLLLNRTELLSAGDAFGVGEPITVIGNTGEATVAAWDQINDRKANVIQVFYANEKGFGGQDTDPLNRITLPYGRITSDLDQLFWPPKLAADGNWTDEDGNWTSSEDYFRLVQWDQINDANVTGLSTIGFIAPGHGLIDNARIQSHYHQSENDTLQTPDFPILFQEPELGLHTFGDGSENVFFDDFGITLEIALEDALLLPVQQ